MPIFVCRVTDQNGRTQRLVREAESEEVLIRDLNREEFYPTAIVEDRRRAGGAAKRFSRKSVQEFVSTLGVLLTSDLTLKDALGIVQATYQKGELNTIAVLLLNSISKGLTITDAVEELGNRFPPIVRGFIRIGEKTGSLAHSITQLSLYISEQAKIRNKLQNSLIYPLLVAVVAVVGIAGIVLFVFPRIRLMFDELGSVVPARMLTIMSVLDFAVPFLSVVFLLLLIGIPLYRIANRRKTRSAEWVSRIVLRLPVVGTYIGLKEKVTFLFAMESLVASGYTIEEALDESVAVAGNRAVREAILDVRERIVKGGGVANAFLANPIFADRIGRWCAIGERTGNVGQVFSQLKNYYQFELEKWNTRIMSLIEPLLILGIGVIVFVVIFFLVVPMFSLYQNIL